MKKAEQEGADYTDDCQLVEQLGVVVHLCMGSYENIKITTKVVEGSPAKSIIEIAEEENVDLIIIASSGKSGIDRFFLGSVAEKVIKNAKNDVLLINKF